MDINFCNRRNGEEIDCARNHVLNLDYVLAVENAPPGEDPGLGDVAYYAPWGNLVVFDQDFRYSAGLRVLGTVESGIEKLARREGEFEATLETLP